MRDMFEEFRRDRSLEIIKFLYILYNKNMGIFYDKYQIKTNDIIWKRDKKYPLVKLISKLRKS